MQVKVHNDNIHPHREKYKGDWIEIPAGGYVMMDDDEAQQFLGQYTPIVHRGDGTPDPRCFKKLRVEHTEKRRAEPPNPLMFHATGQIAKSIEELKQLQGHYSHLMVKEEASDKIEEMSRENDELKARLERLEAALEAQAKPRGRKPKGDDVAESEAKE